MAEKLKKKNTHSKILVAGLKFNKLFILVVVLSVVLAISATAKLHQDLEENQYRAGNNIGMNILSIKAWEESNTEPYDYKYYISGDDLEVTYCYKDDKEKDKFKAKLDKEKIKCKGVDCSEDLTDHDEIIDASGNCATFYLTNISLEDKFKFGKQSTYIEITESAVVLEVTPEDRFCSLLGVCTTNVIIKNADDTEINFYASDINVSYNDPNVTLLGIYYDQPQIVPSYEQECNEVDYSYIDKYTGETIDATRTVCNDKLNCTEKLINRKIFDNESVPLNYTTEEVLINDCEPIIDGNQTIYSLTKDDSYITLQPGEQKEFTIHVQIPTGSYLIYKYDVGFYYGGEWHIIDPNVLSYGEAPTITSSLAYNTTNENLTTNYYITTAGTYSNLTNGLSYWKLNVNEDPVNNEWSGDTGNVQNAVYTANGYLDGGWYHDGTSTERIITTTNIDQSVNKTATFCAWVKPDSSDSTINQIMCSDNGGWDWSMYAQNGDLKLFVGDTQWDTGHNLVNDEWQYVCAVWDLDNIYGYLNGVQSARGSTPTPIQGSYYDTADNGINLGGSQADSSQSWNGTIDEMQIYSRALSEAEIQENYQMYLYLKNGTLEDKPIIDWKKENSSIAVLNSPFEAFNQVTHESVDGDTVALYYFENDAIDETGVNNGTIDGVTYTTSGKVNGAYDFDGVNDNIDLGSGISHTDIITITAWVKPVSFPAVSVIYGRSADMFFLSGSTPAFQEGAPAYPTVTGATAITLDEWSHVAFVKSGDSAGDSKIYVNGVQSDNGLAMAQNLDTAATSIVGARGYDTGADNFNGTIDELQIYDSALNDTQILESYLNGRNYGSDSKDYSTNDNWGVVEGATFNSTGGYDGFGAYEFDGVDDYIDIPFISDLNQSSGYTINMWINPTQMPLGSNWQNDSLLFDSGQDAPYLILSNLNATHHYISGSFWNGSGFAAASSYIISDDNDWVDKWNHISYVYNGTNNLLYINGALQGTASPDGLPTSRVGTSYVGRGVQYDGFRFFNGTIDELQIFNRSLSAEQILALYNNQTDLIVSQETVENDTWSSCLTVNNRFADGTEQCTGELTVGAVNFPNCPDAQMDGNWVISSNDELEQTVTCNTVNVTNSATLTVIGQYTINAANLIVESGSSISGDLYGSAHSAGTGAGTDGDYHDGASGAGHGGVGGLGEEGSGAGSSGGIYGDALNPTTPGSGGGDNYNAGKLGGAGGEAFRLNITDTITLNGNITSSGGDGCSDGDDGCGGGSGGSIFVETVTLTGSGTFNANGGAGGGTNYARGGGGAGGRIAVYFNESSSYTGYSGSTVSGGGNGGGAATSGESGTLIFVDLDDNDAWIRDFTFDPAESYALGTFKTTAGDTFTFNNLSIVGSPRVHNELNITTTILNLNDLATYTCDSTSGTENLSIRVNSSDDTVFDISTVVYDAETLEYDGGAYFTSSCNVVNIYENSTTSQLFDNNALIIGASLWVTNPLYSEFSSTTLTIYDHLYFRDIASTLNITSSTITISDNLNFPALDSLGITSSTVKGNYVIQDSLIPVIELTDSTLKGNMNFNANNFSIDGTSLINGSWLGYGTSAGTGQGTDGAYKQGAGGAGYGGIGGNGETGIAGGIAYDSLLKPDDRGSGGGLYTNKYGGPGGSYIIFNITDTFTHNGNIETTGRDAYNGDNDNSGGGGSGGAIWIQTDTLTGSGTYSANGGSGQDKIQADGGGGAGGRIALYYNSASSSGSAAVTGGTGYDSATDGAAGTIFTCISDNCTAESDTVLLTSNSDISVRTSYSITASNTITKEAIATWANTSIVWNDTASNGATVATYNVTGLIPSFSYSVLDNGVEIGTSPFTSDASGNLELFTVTLSSEHEINITEGLNAAPNTESVILNSTLLTNYTDEDLNCYANITDTDGDNVTGNYTWYKNGVEDSSGQSANFTQGTINLIATLSSSSTSIGDNWTCSVKGYDWTAYESDWNNATLTILGRTPIINFTNPTPVNTFNTTSSSFEQNYSIIPGASLSEILLNTDGTNISIFNSSTVLKMNFDNVSSLGETNTNFLDLINSNNATGYFFDDDEIVSGKYNYGLDLEGISDYLTIPDNTNLDLNGSSTVNMWINPDFCKTQKIIQKRVIDNTTGWEIYMQGNDCVLNAQYSDGTISGGGNLGVNGYITPGSWNMVTMVIDRGNNILVGYINGVRLTSSKTILNVGDVTNDADVTIGMYDSTLYYDGKMDELTIFSELLDTTTILELYNTNLNKINSTNWGLYKNSSLSTDGDHTYYSCVTNSDANEACTTARTITKDSTGPSISVILPEAVTYTQDTRIFNITTNEAVSTCQFSLDSAANVTMTATNTTAWYKTSGIMVEGSHNVIFHCNDTLNNWGSSSLITFGVDTFPPTISLNYPTNNQFFDSGLNLQFNYTPSPDGGTLGSCKLFGDWTGTWEANLTDDSISDSAVNTFNQNITTDGTYLWNVWCNESTGNDDFSAMGNLTFTVDTGDPVINITYPVNGSTYDSYIDMNYTVTEPNADTCWYSLDNYVTNTTATCGVGLSGLSQNIGMNNWSVCANDSSGNVGCDQVTFNSSIGAYDIIINSPTASTVYDGAVNVSFNVTGSFGDTCLYSLDSFSTNNSMADLGSNIFYGSLSLSEGTHLAEFWCNDTFGNIDSNEQVNFSVDTSAPVVTHNTPIDYLTVAYTEVTFYYSVNDDISSIDNCSLYVNSVFQSVDTSITEGATQELTGNVSGASSTWYVSCTNEVGYIGNGTTRTINYDSSLDRSGGSSIVKSEISREVLLEEEWAYQAEDGVCQYSLGESIDNSKSDCSPGIKESAKCLISESLCFYDDMRMEALLMGALAGIVAVFVFRSILRPPKKKRGKDVKFSAN